MCWVKFSYRLVVWKWVFVLSKVFLVQIPGIFL